MDTNSIIVDFQVFSLSNPKYLYIGDSSQWSYAKNKPSYVLITLPGASKPITFSFKKNSVNNFNSINLELSCFKECNDCQEIANLPDGIYTVCVKSGYENIEANKYYLKTDILELEMSKLIADRSLYFNETDKVFRDYMLDINWYLIKARALTSVGDFVNANKFFKEAVKKFERCSQSKLY